MRRHSWQLEIEQFLNRITNAQTNKMQAKRFNSNIKSISILFFFHCQMQDKYMAQISVFFKTRTANGMVSMSC